MAAVTALACSNDRLSAATPREKPAVDPARLQRSLETLFPDLLLHGTRSCLLGMTTSLTKVSGQAHDYFSRLSQVLAFERMMRSFIRLTAAVSPFSIDFGNLWSSALLPVPQAKHSSGLGFFAPFQPQPALSHAPGMPFLPVGFQPQSPAPRPVLPWPDYGMMMIVPMALLAAAPNIEAMWGLAPSV
jgi:hypothetical protein